MIPTKNASVSSKVAAEIVQENSKFQKTQTEADARAKEMKESKNLEESKRAAKEAEAQKERQRQLEKEEARKAREQREKEMERKAQEESLRLEKEYQLFERAVEKFALQQSPPVDLELAHTWVSTAIDVLPREKNFSKNPSKRGPMGTVSPSSICFPLSITSSE